MEIEATRIEYIGILTERILLLLPLSTGRTLDEVELDPQFILTQKIIIENQRKLPHTVGHILLSFGKVLQGIKSTENSDIEKQNASSVLVCKLLSLVLLLRWDRERGDAGEFIANYSQLHYFETPPPLSSDLFHQLIEIYVNLLSPRIVGEVLEMVREDQSDEKTHPSNASYASSTASSFASHQSHSRASSHANKSHSPNRKSHSPIRKPNSPSPPSPAKQSNLSMVSSAVEPDKHIAHMIRYIALACPVEYFNYVYDKIFSYVDLDQEIPETALRKYAPLLRYVFYVDGTTYQEDNVNLIGNAVQASSAYFRALPHIVSPTWKRAFLVLLTASIQDQAFCRPMDYNLIISHKDPDFQAKCQGLFLEAFHAFDESIVETDCSAFVLSWLVSLCLLDFNELLDFPESNSTFKGLEYLRTILHDSSVGTNLESFNALIELFQLGARMLNCDIPDHLVARFSRKYVDHVHSSLHRFRSHFGGDHRKLTLVCINFYTAALMIDPEKYVGIVANMVDKEVRLVLKVVRAVAEAETGKAMFKQLMSVLGNKLREMAIDWRSWSVQGESSSADHMLLTSAAGSGLNSGFAYSTLTFGAASSASLADIFKIFIHAPELYFNDEVLMNDSLLDTDFDSALTEVVSFCKDISLPIRFAFKSSNKELFESASTLSFVLVKNAPKYSSLLAFSNYVVSNMIVQSICEACLQASLTSSHFKACFILLTNFLQSRDLLKPLLKVNRVLRDQRTREYFDYGRHVSHVMEKVLLLAMCTHDVVFYNAARVAMRWYCEDLDLGTLDYDELYSPGGILPKSISLRPTFQRVVNDTGVFTGFVSLHKTFRTILREAHPTPSLYQVWLLIYDRWQSMTTQTLSGENLVFRHYTGFLVSTSGCFFSEEFLRDDPAKQNVLSTISAFFDKCVSLLRSPDLVVRVVVKEALAKETHPAVYNLSTSKMTALVKQYESKGSEPLFVEQVLIIITGMTSAKHDGSYVLVAMLPQISKLFVNYIKSVEGEDAIKLKLRFCKWIEVIESEKDFYGVGGSFRLRNWLAKVTCEWLDEATGDVLGKVSKSISEKAPGVTSPTAVPWAASGASSASSSTGNVSSSYLQLDLAIQSSKTLSLQLASLKLDIPDGTKEIQKYKDLAFGNYFSMFYKIIQKYTAADSPPKAVTIIDNILRAMLNLLQYDTDIGMQFVLLLGYHENPRIRSLFINLFSSILTTRKNTTVQDDFPEELVPQFCELPMGSIADSASLTEHNLLASSLFGIFGYGKKLDVLFRGLLGHEIGSVTRSTEMFRRNSPLTRLLSNFAGDYGEAYLVGTLGDFIEDLIVNEVVVEVEKANNNEWNLSPVNTITDNQVSTLDPVSNTEDATLYLKYLDKLVTAITSSSNAMPLPFKFLCSEIYKAVKTKFADAALIAVGSFLFLRFMCPAIISPEVVFKVEIKNPKVKRTLMQLVKVLQNMANGSLSLLKWPGLVGKMPELIKINAKITSFLEEISTTDIPTYPFEPCPFPAAELNYLHKFLYTYIALIKSNYIVHGNLTDTSKLHTRVVHSRELDRITKQLGLPKLTIKLQLTSQFKTENGSISTAYTNFMAKMSVSHIEKWNDVCLVSNLIFSDGTPVVVLNFGRLKEVDNDVDFLFFRLYEIACQVWDNKFYLVYDFTEFFYAPELGARYLEILKTCTPQQFFDNCSRIYFFNIPRAYYEPITGLLIAMRISGLFPTLDTHYHSLIEPPSVIDNLCLDALTVNVPRDTRVIFKEVELWDPKTGWVDVSLRMGRKWVLICLTRKIVFMGNKSLSLVDVYRLMDIVKCEVVPDNSDLNLSLSGSQNTSRKGANNDSSGGVSAGALAPSAAFSPSANTASAHFLPIAPSPASSDLNPSAGGTADQFTILLTSGVSLTLRASQRSEILRFLYFTTLRLKSASYIIPALGSHILPWFGRLYNIAFQGLLSDDEPVRTSSALLFGSLSTYFSIDFGIKTSHAKNIAFPANTSDFVESVSLHLARNFPHMTYRFFKAFFDNSEKLSPTTKLNSTIYLAPWVDNIYENIYLSTDSNGPEQVADLVRRFCRLSAGNKEHIAFVNDYIWKKLFAEPRIIPVLVDEVIAFAIDNKNDGPDWWFIIAVIFPSVEVCGDVIARLIACVNKTLKNESAIAEQSNLFEIKVLVKICSSLFFNSYALARLYLADIFFLATIFIDNVYLDFGPDLQKLFVNVIQSFLHKPNLTKEEHDTVDSTIAYFSDQRANMLFGLTRDISDLAMYAVQLYNRAMTFEMLCDYLGDFITALAADDDKVIWTARWSSNVVAVAFNVDCIFQTRAILVLGILAKKGVAAGTVSKSLKMLSQNPSNNLEYLTNGIFMTARMLEGLPHLSLHAVMIWPGFCYGLLNYTNLYQGSVLSLMTSIVKLSEGGVDFMDAAFEQRMNLEPYMSSFEKSQGVNVTRENFGIHIFYVLTRGLKVSHFKHNSLKYLKDYLKLRCGVKLPQSHEQYGGFENTASRSTMVKRALKEAKARVITERQPLHLFDFCAYLVFIYLAADDAGFAEYMDDLNDALEDTNYSLTNYDKSDTFPEVVRTFLSSNSIPAQLTILLAAQFYTSPTTDSKFKLRFLQVYLLILQTAPETALIVLHLLRPAWMAELVNSSNMEMIELISQIMALVIEFEDYDSKKAETFIEEQLEKYQVNVLCREDGMSTTRFVDMKLPAYNNVHLLVVMAYRSACLHVDGHELED